MTNIIAFGHSITAGFWDTEGGWVQRLRTFLDERALEQEDEELVYYVYNLGVGGDTTEELLERLDELERRLSERNIVLIQIGANDYLEENGEMMVPSEKFRENLEEIISDVREVADYILLVGDGYTSIEGSLPWDMEKPASDRRAKDYHRIRENVAREVETPYISIREEFDKERWLEMLEDGVHPDNRGHKEIYQLVRKRLEREEII